MENNIDPLDYDDDDDKIVYDFHAVRIMKKTSKTRIARHLIAYPHAKPIMKIMYSPNSINLWHRIKNSLGSGRNKKIIISGCKFSLCKKYTKNQLMKDIIEIHNERLNYDNDIIIDE